MRTIRSIIPLISFFSFLFVFWAGTVLAEKPQIDCSKIRGVCYGPGAPEEQVRRELSYGQRVGLNATRFWLSQRAWEARGDEYVKQIVNFIRICDSCGYKCMPILFNGNMLNPETIKPEAYEKADAYATAFVTALKSEPGLLMIDVMNEPLCSPWIFQSSGEERKGREQEIWAFLRRETELVRRLAPDTLVTIGYTTAWEIEESTARLCDVISFHDYNDTREKIRANFERAKKWGEDLGKPVINTETGCLARANPYELVLQFCNEYQMGWYLFELMIHGRCSDEHGIFYPDGTIRDAGTIAAMFGCYRNRGESIIPPNPNREKKAERAIQLIREALTEYRSVDFFEYRRSDKKKLLDACEVAANLLEACELVPMSDLPTAKIEKFRKDPNADIVEIRKFAFELAEQLKKLCQIL